jgi:alginate O-acetyltransferase complex protein AlgI
MLFTEFRFLIFFAIAFSVYWLLKSNKNRLFWLLLCSYIFYGAWDWRFLSLIILSTLLDYCVGWQLEKQTHDLYRKLLISFSLLTNLGILGFFKYCNFFLESGINLLNFLGIPVSSTTLNIVLPVGISFYTFQTISYSLDVYLGKMRPEKKLLNFAVFISFFPQLVAGSIVRASTFLPQLKQARTFDLVKIRYLLLLFLIGYIKKACVSDNIAPFVDSFFANPEDYTALSAWIGVLLYTIQIYCDFSGYSDMAIACAGFLGYELCLNFDFPYFSSSITEFWRRWHISLSTWLRDYLYIPCSKFYRAKTKSTRRFCDRGVRNSSLWNGLSNAKPYLDSMLTQK